MPSSWNAGLQAPVVEQRELHRVVHRQRLRQQLGRRAARWCRRSAVGARPAQVLAQTLLGRLLDRAEAAVGAERGAAARHGGADQNGRQPQPPARRARSAQRGKPRASRARCGAAAPYSGRGDIARALMGPFRRRSRGPRLARPVGRGRRDGASGPRRRSRVGLLRFTGIGTPAADAGDGVVRLAPGNGRVFAESAVCRKRRLVARCGHAGAGVERVGTGGRVAGLRVCRDGGGEQCRCTRAGREPAPQRRQGGTGDEVLASGVRMLPCCARSTAEPGPGGPSRVSARGEPAGYARTIRGGRSGPSVANTSTAGTTVTKTVAAASG